MLTKDKAKEVSTMPIVDMTVGDVMEYFNQIIDMADNNLIDSSKDVVLALTAARCEFVSECVLNYHKQKQTTDFSEKAKEVVKAEVEEKPFIPSRAKTELPAYPGQIITMNFGGDDRKFRVINVDKDGYATLVALFSIGEVFEKEDIYTDSRTDNICETWFNFLPTKATEAMRTTILPNGHIRFIHAPVMVDIQKALRDYNDDCYDWLWENDEDTSSFRVIAGNKNAKNTTAVMGGEDGEIHIYSDDEDDDGFTSFEVHPSFTINLRKYSSFEQDDAERAECKANYEEVNGI